MIRNSLIALSAAAALGLALAPAAQAKTNIDVNLGLGFGGGYGGGYGGAIYVGDGYYDGGYADDCHYVKVKHKKWNKWHTKKIVFFTKELVCY